MPQKIICLILNGNVIKMTIQKATLNDIDQLTKLFDQYLVFYKKPSNLEKHKSYLKQRIEKDEAYIFIAFDKNNNGIGFTLLYPTFSSVKLDKILILNDLFVDSSIRNCGIGEQLINRSILLAKELKIDMIRLRTANDNLTSQGLYDKIGFKRDEIYYTYDLNL